MGTTHTDVSWYWYVRKRGRRYYLGLIDQNGDVPDGAYDIVIRCDEIPDEITSDDDSLPIPELFEHGFAMGCVYEVLRMDGKELPSYKQDYEEAIKEARGRQVEETQQPLVLMPLDMRDD